MLHSILKNVQISMLIAKDKKGNYINAADLTDKRGTYFCPACESLVILKSGPIMINHFAHQSLNHCENRSENESAQHLSLKLKLFNWLNRCRSTKVELEKYLPHLEQTPDLLVNENIAIEVQCSSLSLKRLSERTKNYQRCGIKVIWLMGQDLWLNQRMSQLQRNLMYFSNNCGFYFWELDNANDEVRLKSLIHEDVRGEIYYVTKYFQFYHDDLLEILRFPFQQQPPQKIKISPLKLVNQENYIKKQLYHRNPRWLKIQEKYYLRGQNLMTSTFSYPLIGPVGFDLLFFKVSPQRKQTFCQIDANISDYYRRFAQNIIENQKSSDNLCLYPPHFYAIMEDKSKEEKDS